MKLTARLLLFLLISLLSYTTTILGQIKIHETFGVRDGLVQSQVLAIFKDQAGYLWFGTLEGLSRWDGISFRNYNTIDGLAGSRVYAIHQSENGELFFGTDGGGVSLFRNGSFETIDKSGGLTNNSVMTISEDKTGTLYFCTWGGGVSIYRDGQIIANITTANGLTDNRVRSSLVARSGDIHLGTRHGVSILRDGAVIGTVLGQHGLPNDFVHAIHESDDGSIYYGTYGGGVAISNGTSLQILTEKHGLANNQVVAITENDRSEVFFGTYGGGVSLYRNDRFETLDQENGLANNFIFSAFHSTDGLTFFGTDGGGISIYQSGRFETLNLKTGLINNVVWSIESGPSGEVYLGTSGGLSVFTDGKFSNLTQDNGLPATRIYSVYRARDGSVYLGTDGGGVAIYRSGSIKNLGTDRGLTDNSVLSIAETEDGTLYFGTYSHGISVFRNGAFADAIDESAGLLSDAVKTVYATGGTVYAGTESGVSIIENDNVIRSLTVADGLIHNTVLSVLKDRKGRLFFGTPAGLTLLDDSTLLNFSTKDGLSNNVIAAIEEDDDGNIYVTTNKGINILSFRDHEFNVRTLRQSDGLASDECNHGALLKDPTGVLWIGTVGGVSRYDRTKDTQNSKPPRVHITRVRLFDEDLDPMTHTMRFPHDQNFFKFDFIGIDWLAPEKVVYRYRIAGVDRDWVETRQRFVQYTNLDDADYLFEVKARNEWGYWSEPRTLAFTVRPAWWETWIFRVFLAAAGLTAVFLMYRQRVRSISKKKEDLEVQVTERTRQLRLKTDELVKTLETLKKTQTQLIHSEKMASLGQVVAGIAHEINNPTSFIEGNLDYVREFSGKRDQLIAEYERLLKTLERPETADAIEQLRGKLDYQMIKEESDDVVDACQKGCIRIRKIVEDLRNFSRLGESEFKAADINQGIESTLSLLKNEFGNRIAVETKLEPLPEIECHPAQLNQVFFHLLVNASQAIPEKGTIYVSTAKSGDTVTIVVRDTGDGIRPEIIEKIFDPFFTTKDVGKGSGLGLSICYGIIATHGGTINVSSKHKKGTTATIELPLSRPT